MSKEAFAKLIITKLRSAVGADGAKYTSDTPTKAQQALAAAITEYLIANTVVKISYVGVLTSGTGTDTVVTDTLKIAGSCGSIGKPSDFPSWVNKIQSVIASSFSVVSPGVNGVVVQFQPFNSAKGALQIPQGDLKAVFEKNMSDPTNAVWQVICGKIIDWINSNLGKNPAITAISATRPGVSAGTASLTSITIP